MIVTDAPLVLVLFQKLRRRRAKSMVRPRAENPRRTQVIDALR
jgi:hypothetical protein